MPSASRLAIVTAVLVLLSAWTYARPRALDVRPPAFEAVVPMAFAGWTGVAAPKLDPEVARVLAADEYVHRYYGVGSAESGPPATGSPLPIEMDIAYYARPHAGAAMHSPLNCLPGNGWQVIESRTMPVAIPAGAVDVRRLVVGRSHHRIAMTYWFQNRGEIVGNEYRQRLRFLSNGLQGRATDAALVRVMALDNAPGRDALALFTRDLVSRLGAAFR